MEYASGINAELLIDGCQQIFGADGVRGWKRSHFIRSPIGTTRFDTSPGEYQAVTVWPVVTATIVVEFWGTSKFTHHDNQCFGEPAPSAQILDQP